MAPLAAQKPQPSKSKLQKKLKIQTSTKFVLRSANIRRHQERPPVMEFAAALPALARAWSLKFGVFPEFEV
jgi:hypothetical protein